MSGSTKMLIVRLVSQRRTMPGVSYTYGMRVVLEVPVAAADREAGQKPRVVPVSNVQPVKVWQSLTMCHLMVSSLKRELHAGRCVLIDCRLWSFAMQVDILGGFKVVDR
jgi:hypothetical protein